MNSIVKLRVRPGSLLESVVNEFLRHPPVQLVELVAVGPFTLKEVECKSHELTVVTLDYVEEVLDLKPQPSVPSSPSPIPMRLTCPSCGTLHVDEGEFTTKPHHTHACQNCGMVWRPALLPTVGVKFLPGFKNPQGGA